jgi:hypothetical protein
LWVRVVSRAWRHSAHSTRVAVHGMCTQPVCACVAAVWQDGGQTLHQAQHCLHHTQACRVTHTLTRPAIVPRPCRVSCGVVGYAQQQGRWQARVVPHLGPGLRDEHTDANSTLDSLLLSRARKV